MRKTLSYVVIALMMLTLLQCKKGDTEQSLSIHSMIGDVKLITNSVEKIPAVGDVLKEGDMLITGELSVADLLLGNEGIIRIQQNSEVKMASLISKTNNDTQLDMDNGKIHVTLSKMRKGSFSVKTPTAVASVRGTSFRISAAKTISRCDVLTGKVKINPVDNDKIITDVEQILGESEAAKIDTETVEKAVKEKKEIEVIALNVDEINEIKAEVQDIKPELIDKLDVETKKELKEEILDQKGDDTKAKEEEKLKRDQERALAMKKQEEKEKKRIEDEEREKARLAAARENERLEKERLEKERKEKERKEKERRERASNIPTL